MTSSSSMTSRPRLFALAGALVLAACGSSAEVAPPARAQSAESAALAVLLGEARAAAAAQDRARAERKLDEALALAPESPAVWIEVARQRYRGGEHFGALEAADHAVALGPQYGGALLLKAQLVRDAHGLAASLPWFEAACAADPDNPEVWLDHAATLGDLGRNRDMLDALTRLGELAPQEPRANHLTAVLAARAGNAVLARSLLERSAPAGRDTPAALMLDALIAMSQGNYISATDGLERLLERHGDYARARELLARTLFMSGRDAEVTARFGRGMSPDKTSPYLAMLVGRAHERLGERDKAAAWLERAHAGGKDVRLVLPLNPGLAAPVAAARTAANAGDWSGASVGTSAVRRRLPGSADIAALTGDVALGRGDALGALGAYAEAARVRRSWPLSRKLVAAYRAAGDAEAADALLIRHVAGDPNNIDALLLLAVRSVEWQDGGRATLLLDHVAVLGGANDLTYRRLRADVAAQSGG
jgi:tetratricopeptide (TPR) repeat protein